MKRGRKKWFPNRKKNSNIKKSSSTSKSGQNKTYEDILDQRRRKNPQTQPKKRTIISQKSNKREKSSFSTYFSGANKAPSNTNISKPKQKPPKNTFRRRWKKKLVVQKSNNENNNNISSNSEGSSSSSSSNILLDKIISRSRKMSRTQQMKILEFLDGLIEHEKSNEEIICENENNMIIIKQKKDDNKKKLMVVVDEFFLILRIFSNWEENLSRIGIGRIEFKCIDDENNGFGISENDIFLFDDKNNLLLSSKKEKVKLLHVCNTSISTNFEFVNNSTKSAKFLDVRIKMKKEDFERIEKIDIWNYNVRFETDKGIKRVKLFSEEMEEGKKIERELYEGEIGQANGDMLFEYFTTIEIKENFENNLRQSLEIQEEKSFNFEESFSDLLDKEKEEEGRDDEKSNFDNIKNELSGIEGRDFSLSSFDLENSGIIKDDELGELDTLKQDFILPSMKDEIEIKVVKGKDVEKEVTKKKEDFSEVENLQVYKPRKLRSFRRKSRPNVVLTNKRQTNKVDKNYKKNEPKEIDLKQSYDSLRNFNMYHSSFLDDSNEFSNEENENFGKELLMRRKFSKWNLKEIKKNVKIEKSEKSEKLPIGQNLVFNILSTHGDPHYVGLHGLEIFDGKGDLINLDSVHKQVTSDPRDVNELPMHNNDPRTVDKLFDGVNKTTSELHGWLAPFAKKGDHTVTVRLNDRKTEISMIKIWNYNTSRIHSYRGVKNLEIRLNNKIIFRGVIKKANGIISTAEKFAHSIFFTRNEKVLENIKSFSKLYRTKSFSDSTGELKRPTTSEIREHEEILERFANMDENDRPLTSITSKKVNEDIFKELQPKMLNVGEKKLEKRTKSMYTIKNDPTRRKGRRRRKRKKWNVNKKDNMLLRSINNFSGFLSSKYEGNIIRIELLENYGNQSFIGLNGLEFFMLNSDKDDLELIDSRQSIKRIKALPHEDLNARNKEGSTFPKKDTRVIANLLNQNNISEKKSDAWLTYKGEKKTQITIEFRETIKFGGLKIWNYNIGGEEGTYCGVQAIKLSINDNVIRKRLNIPKAPGSTNYDFSHLIFFDKEKDEENKKKDERVLKEIQTGRSFMRSKMCFRKEYITPIFPTGYVMTIKLVTTHGDGFYVGLNGIKIYDALNNEISLSTVESQTEKQENVDGIVYAHPTSIRKLSGCSNDIRTLDKLINGNNVTWDPKDMWLSPYIGGISKDEDMDWKRENEIYINFNHHVSISMVKIWNYSKTPSRGVKDVEIYLDSVLIYQGIVPMAPGAGSRRMNFEWPIFFTNNEKILNKNGNKGYNHYYSSEKNPIVYFNNRRQLNKGANKKDPQKERPKTSTSNKNKWE